MPSFEVRPFRRSDREQLTELVNAHAAAVVCRRGRVGEHGAQPPGAAARRDDRRPVGRDGQMVSARAWPDHPAWMREFVTILRSKAPA
jgi:hypothetical protein